jgi:hypothetical protein
VALSRPNTTEITSGLMAAAWVLVSASSGSRPAMVVVDEIRMARRPVAAGLAGGRRRIQPALAVRLDEMDQQDGVVDHDAGQRGRADQRRHGEVVAHEHMTPDGADEGQRDRQHDDQRLHVAAELEREDHEDPHQPDQQAAADGAAGLGGAGHLPLEGPPPPRDGAPRNRASRCAGRRRWPGRWLARIHVGLHGDGALPVDAGDARPVAPLLGIGHHLQCGTRRPSGRTNRLVRQVIEAVAVLLGLAHQYFDLLVADALGVGDLAEQGGAQLAGHLLGGQPQAVGALGQEKVSCGLPRRRSSMTL